MTYIELIIDLLNKITNEEHLKRIYKLAEYLYLYKSGN